MNGDNAIERLLAAIGYPERMSGDASSFLLRVDGMEIEAAVSGERLVLTYALAADDSHLPTLATYAAGRILKEEAALARENARIVLWQDAPADADKAEMLRLFETFANSCDWWRTRTDELRGEQSASGEAAHDETMMIRP